MLEASVTITPRKIKLPKLDTTTLTAIIRRAARQIRGAVRRATPVDTSAARESWTPLQKIEGGYSFQSDLPYVPVLEYGSEAGAKPWPTAGDKTVENRGKIYSSQAPEGFMAKSKAEQIINKVFEKAIRRAFKK